MQLVRERRSKYEKNIIDEKAKDVGIEILRLTPYHCLLNAIEMEWTQVKHYVKNNNTSLREVT